jgi:hypothetical protein
VIGLAGIFSSVSIVTLVKFPFFGRIREKPEQVDDLFVSHFSMPETKKRSK